VHKRVVFIGTEGPGKGIPQIRGYFGEEDGLPPEFVDRFTGIADRHVPFASLVKVTPRYVLYREVFAAPKGQFGVTMESWHPDQR